MLTIEIVIMLQKHGRKSWSPWAISVAFDLVSLAAGFRESVTPLEKEEWSRRVGDLLYYTLREPFYTSYSK
jgi:hypothetical protein